MRKRANSALGLVAIATMLLVAGAANGQTVTYSLGIESELLDTDFYDGKAAPLSLFY